MKASGCGRRCPRRRRAPIGQLIIRPGWGLFAATSRDFSLANDNGTRDSQRDVDGLRHAARRRVQCPRQCRGRLSPMITLGGVNQISRYCGGRAFDQAFLELAQEHFLLCMVREGLFANGSEDVVFKGEQRSGSSPLRCAAGSRLTSTLPLPDRNTRSTSFSRSTRASRSKASRSRHRPERSIGERRRRAGSPRTNSPPRSSRSSTSPCAPRCCRRRSRRAGPPFPGSSATSSASIHRSAR